MVHGDPIGPVVVNAIGVCSMTRASIVSGPLQLGKAGQGLIILKFFNS